MTVEVGEDNMFSGVGKIIDIKTVFGLPAATTTTRPTTIDLPSVFNRLTPFEKMTGTLLDAVKYLHV